jgi:hypothetical protein
MHVTALSGAPSGAKQVMDTRGERHAPPEGRRDLAGREEHPILVAESRRSADDRGLLSDGARVTRDPTLSLEAHQATIELASEHHLLVQCDRKLVGDGA